MIFYFKLGKLRTLIIELNSELGKKPFYKKTSFRCETILDVPYTQIIFNSGKWTPAKHVQKIKAANDDTEKKSKTNKIREIAWGAYKS